MVINKEKKYCYRITHIQNLPLILDNGIVNKKHPDADGNFIEIGNREIIDVRSTTPVRIEGYGMIGDYVPFYFTPKSMMLYNIITGYRAPVVPKRNRNEILVVRCLISELAKLKKWFFTDGQANIKDGSVKHYNSLSDLGEVDWESIQQSNFSKSDGDFDRPRRYQAEFLVHSKVPLKCIESLNVFNQSAADYVNGILKENNINLAVNIQRQYFF
jgi:hypothetical protein